MGKANEDTIKFVTIVFYIIFQGDSLITTCTYNTVNRDNVTLGGFAISDEMCVNYIHYYPNARLEVNVNFIILVSMFYLVDFIYIYDFIYI